MRSQRMGLRLWGIAELPFWRSLNGSSASSTSVICSRRMVVARRSSTAPRMAIAETNDGVAVAGQHLRGGGRDGEAEARADVLLDRGATRDACVPTAPLIWPTAISAVAARRRSRERRTSS